MNFLSSLIFLFELKHELVYIKVQNKFIQKSKKQLSQKKD